MEPLRQTQQLLSHPVGFPDDDGRRDDEPGDGRIGRLLRPRQPPVLRPIGACPQHLRDQTGLHAQLPEQADGSERQRRVPAADLVPRQGRQLHPAGPSRDRIGARPSANCW